MNRILKRPMFRMGGSSGTGITSGFDRPGYKQAGSVQGQMIYDATNPEGVFRTTASEMLANNAPQKTSFDVASDAQSRIDLANRFAELSMLNKSNAASIRGSQFTSTTAPLDFFDSIKLKELRLVIKKISLADSDAFTLGFQTLTTRKLDFGDTMGPLETVTTIITDEDFT